MMKSFKIMRTMQLLAFLGVLITFSLALDASSGALFGDSDIHDRILGSLSADLITGHTPYSSDASEYSPRYTEEELSETTSMDTDNKILDACSEAHRNSADCYHLMKSIISVTSQGNIEHSSELGDGLLPLRSSYTDLSTEELYDPEENLREASRYLMTLYDSYNGDLAFTSMAYIAGRGASNSIMYSVHDRDVEQIDAGLMISELEEQYDELSNDLDLLPFEEIAQYYIDILFAYNVWADKVMADSSLEQLMYDHGTISVNPSFSTGIEYDIKQIDRIHDMISSYIENSGTRRTSDGVYEDVQPSFNDLRSYMVENYEDYEIDGGGDAAPISMDNLTWKEGMCNPVLDKFNKVVDRFIQCVEMDEQECYCDFS
ncbi:MAG: transglycosylase SLT domain-containing protein, partial [Candidatus Woesearchaeota archaeon]